MEAYYIIIVLTLIYISFRYKRRYKRYIFDSSFVFALIWLATSGMVVVDFYFFGESELSMGYNLVGYYILFFVSIGLLGFEIACINRAKQVVYFEFSENYLNTILQKIKPLFYISFLISILKIATNISVGGMNSLYDFRQNAFSMSQQSSFYALLTTISAHINIISAFYVIILSVKHALYGINKKELIVTFFIFSFGGISIGGRMFIIGIIAKYFFPFFLVRSLYPSFFIKNERKFIMNIFVVLFALVAVLGVFRNNHGEVNDFKEDVAAKYLYLKDGVNYTTAVAFYFPTINNLDYGRNFFQKDLRNSQYTRIRDSETMELYAPIVPGVIPLLIFDWGYVGAVLFWGGFCFFVGLVENRCFKKMSIVSLLLIIGFVSFMLDTPLFISGSIGLQKHIMWVFIFSLYFRKTYYSVNRG